MAAKGAVTPPETRAKMSRSWALRNAVREAGEAVLNAAAEGDDTTIVAVARERYAALRAAGWVTRLMPPGEAS